MSTIVSANTIYAMKLFILAIWLVVASATLDEHITHFQAFKLKHGKSYNNQEEESRRFAIFTDNLRDIEQHNQGDASYKKGLNQFSDMTKEEIQATLNPHLKSTAPSPPGAIKYQKKGLEIPKSVDWRSQQVSPVKNQRHCSSCWSFSVTGATEAAYARKTGKVVELSQQQLIDCNKRDNRGCLGGLTHQNYPYIEQNGLQSEASYPYIAMDFRQCAYNASAVVTRVSSYVLVLEDEDALLEAVATVGPVSVLVDATSSVFYESGIFSDKSCSRWNLNHAVLVVGYGSENGKDFWIVKNSWGTEWGEDGYYRLLRGNNECGVAETCNYPIID